ncbi:40S ribosomal protein S30 [Zea mays]|uniref:40S ribosomal protein S30 n=1 Tax=Zea mays TaxID=4577 RepID=A0A1D6QBW9_MAIZE|nr:40S ribosomal protein S30 [Zea mays]
MGNDLLVLLSISSCVQVQPANSCRKVHGSLARAGKVRGQTPKVAKQDKKKKPRGRAYKRMQYNRRFVTAVVGFGKKRGPNSSEK